MILSLYNVGAAGVTAPEAVVAYALGYGGFVQWLGECLFLCQFTMKDGVGI